MVGWIVTLVLYAVGMGLFHFLGGIGAAGEAIEEWARNITSGRTEDASSSTA
jgi:hypothetical protein